MKRIKKSYSKETFVFIIFTLALFTYISSVMGVSIMFSVIMNTAHRLLLDTVFYIMAIAVLTGALSSILVEFGVVALINKIISPIMKPIYDMPGAASLGIMTTFLSDNPAIITLAKDKGFIKYFKRYQVPALCNLGTSFGMGLILITYMISLNFILPTIIGLISAIIGSVISVRIMQHYSKKYYRLEHVEEKETIDTYSDEREIRDGNFIQRALEALLDGGKNGVELGLDIIPGVIIICTFVMILTFGPSETGYKGVAFEGVALLPKLASSIDFILTPLFGFSSSKAISFPVTALGSAGAAMPLVKTLLKTGEIGANEIAVFTAMGMCWSGYLSTHIAMMDALMVRKFTNKAIISHTIGGLVAGVTAHYLYLFSLLF